MQLDEMLAHIREYLDDVQGTLIEGDNDQLWSDDAIVRHLNQAMRILCRRAWVIIENGIAPAGIIVIKTGVSLYPLHESVLRVYDATPAGQALPLGRSEDINIRDTSLYGVNPNDNAFQAFEIGEQAALAGMVTTLSGTPLAIATDAGSRVARIFPPPTSTENGLKVNLKIARLPVNWLTLDDTSAEPETPRDWDLDLCEYAMGKCLMRPNIDTQSKADGRELLTQFNDAIKEARRDRQRQEYGPSRWNFSSATALLR